MPNIIGSENGRRRNSIRLKLYIVCIFCTFIIGCFLALSPMTTDVCDCSSDSNSVNVHQMSLSNHKDNLSPSKHKLAVLVPYRNRFEELLVFVPYIHDFLNKQHVDHHIYVLNQVDRYRFNRASLINVGFRLSREECDYIAMHDVDLLPLNPQLSYAYPRAGPFHVASPQLHPRYNYPTFVGGILLLRREDFEAVNGMSNKYWGWGLEDDEFYVRLKEAGLNVTRPVNVSTGTEDTFKHSHDRVVRRRDMAKCHNQREVTRRRDRQTGLRDVHYRLEGVRRLSVDGAPMSLANIHLECDRALTPWCDCSTEPKARKKPA